MGVRAEQAAALRGALLRSAAEHFEGSGFVRTRLADIAASAGVTTGAFYRYFPTKLDVFQVLFEQYADAVTAHVVDAEDLDGFCRAWLSVHREHRGVLRAAEEIANNDADLRSRHLGYRKVWAASAFTHLRAEPDAALRKSLSFVTIDVLEYLSFAQWHGWSSVDDEALASSLARLLREGVFPEGESPPVEQAPESHLPERGKATAVEPPPVRWQVASGRIEPNSARGRAQRDAVVRSAMTVFSNQGYEHTSIGGIADHAGVSAATVYRYFKDKRDVFVFLLANAERSLWARSMFTISDDGRVHTGEIVANFLRARESDTSVYVVWRELLDSDQEMEGMWITLRENFHEGLARVIGRCQRLGTVSGEYEPAVVAELIVAFFDGPAHARFDMGWTNGMSNDDLARALTSRLGP